MFLFLSCFWEEFIWKQASTSSYLSLSSNSRGRSPCIANRFNRNRNIVIIAREMLKWFNNRHRIYGSVLLLTIDSSTSCSIVIRIFLSFFPKFSHQNSEFVTKSKIPGAHTLTNSLTIYPRCQSHDKHRVKALEADRLLFLHTWWIHLHLRRRRLRNSTKSKLQRKACPCMVVVSCTVPSALCPIANGPEQNTCKNS